MLTLFFFFLKAPVTKQHISSPGMWLGMYVSRIGNRVKLNINAGARGTELIMQVCNDMRSQKEKEEAHLAEEFFHSRVWRSEVCGNCSLGCSPGSRRRQRTLESLWLVESLEENTITQKINNNQHGSKVRDEWLEKGCSLT